MFGLFAGLPGRRDYQDGLNRPNGWWASKYTENHRKRLRSREHSSYDGHFTDPTAMRTNVA